MKKNNIKSEFNFSKTGKFSIRKYLYLLDKDNYMVHLDKILSKKPHEKLVEDNYLDNSDIKTNNEESEKNDILQEEDIFDDDYKNNHNEIIEEQKSKYLYPRDKYKYHTTHLNLNNERINCKVNNNHKLLLNCDKDNFMKRNVYSQSFEKMLGRNDTNKKNTMNNNNITNKNGNFSDSGENYKKKKKDILLKKIIENNIKNDMKGYITIKSQTMRGDIPSHNDVRIRIEKKFITNNDEATKNNLSLNKNEKNKLSPAKTIYSDKLPYITKYNNRAKKDNKYIYEKSEYFLIKKLKKNLKRNTSLSLTNINNSSTARGISFNNMLSRVRKNVKKYHQIENLHYPCTPNYSSIYPKMAMNVFYDKKTYGKDYSPKLKGLKDEYIFDINKVYNKYNNHIEPKSFSLDKMVGRDTKCKLYNFVSLGKDEDNKELITERRNNLIKEKIDLIKSFFKSDKLNDTNKKDKKIKNIEIINYNNKLENIYKQLIEKDILNKEVMNENDKNINKIIKGNKINSNYKKIINNYNRIKMTKYNK